MEPCSDHGQITAMIPEPAFLLVGIVVFFIHDNQTQILKRGKDCRPGTDSHHGLLSQDSHPLVKTLSQAKAAVEQGDALTEACPKEPFHLGNERNFRHEYKGLLFFLESSLHSPHIDLCLATGGNTVKKIGLKSLAKGVQHTPDNRRLVPGQDWSTSVRFDRFAKRVSIDVSMNHSQEPCVGHLLDEWPC